VGLWGEVYSSCMVSLWGEVCMVSLWVEVYSSCMVSSNPEYSYMLSVWCDTFN